MNMDAKQFGAELALIVQNAVDPLKALIEAQGKSLTEQAALIEAQSKTLAAQTEQISALEMRGPVKGIDGKSVTIDDVLPAITEQVSKHLEAIPAPKDGEDGKSVTVDDIMPALTKRVDDFLAAIPLPKDGEPGRDGLDVKDMFRADGGRLVAVMSDGTTKDLGKFVGDDGKPGLDGVGFDDMTVEHDGERKAVLRFTKGERVVENVITLPTVIYRGVFKAEQPYERGDSVTQAGSTWIATKDTSERPGDGADWVLSVKRGRDGKDGELKPPTDPKPVRLG